jgi:hypothetical protein
MDVLETTTPHTPPTSHEARPPIPTVMATPRLEKRRRWQEDKIKNSRDKSKKKPATTPAEQSRPEASTSAATETHDVPHDSHAICTAGGRLRVVPHRSASEWKVIRELKLCAGCLTKTIPPHKPGDEHAVCTGQPHAQWNKAEIARIRKASNQLKGRNKLPEQGQIRAMQHNEPVLPACHLVASIQSGNATSLGFGPGPYPAHVNVGYGNGYHLAVGSSYVAPPTPGHFFTLPVPGPRSHGPSFYLHPQNRLARSTQYSQRQVAPSDSSATHVDGLDEAVVAGEPLIVRTPQRAPALMKTPTKRSRELEFNVLGIDPPTPDTTGLPENLIEEFGPTGMQPEHTTVMPASESSGLVPIDPVKPREWDGETKVADEPDDALKNLVADLSSIEKSLSKRNTVLPEERSWTLKGLQSSSLVSHVPMTRLDRWLI